MVQELATPYRGATHVGWQQIEKHAPAGVHDAVYMIGRYGSLDLEGAFVPDAELGPVYRRIVGPEFDAFMQSVIVGGRPTDLRGEWRESDLAAWLETWGLTNETNSWEDPNAEPSPEVVP